MMQIMEWKLIVLKRRFVLSIMQVTLNKIQLKKYSINIIFKVGQGNLTMRKCTKKPGAFECEEIELLGVQLEACYCESDLCNKDQGCTCGLKCQTCLGEDGACLEPNDNGITSYCLKGQSCAYVHQGNFSWIDLELFIFIKFYFRFGPWSVSFKKM